MDTKQTENIYHNPATGEVERVQSTEHIPSKNEIFEEDAEKKNQVVWYIVGVINAILVLRFIFLLLDAQDIGFAKVLYNVSDPFVSLFKGIFASPTSSGAYFDSASILAIVIYSLIAWGITSLIEVAQKPASHS